MLECLSPESLRLRASGKWVDFDEDIVPSNPAEMDFAVAPVILEAVQEAVDHQRFGYSSHGPNGPEAQLKKAFQARMKSKFDWSVDTDTVLPVTNLVQAIAATIFAFSEKGEGVSVQIPAYPMFLAAIKQTGRNAVCNVMPVVDGRYELDVEALTKQITKDVKILLLCHPQNPTGRVFSKEELAPLAKLAEEKGLIVISDEIHCDIHFDGRKHTPFLKMFPELADQTVTLQSASKTFNIPGLGCAVMYFGSQALMDRFSQKLPPMLLGRPGITGMLGTIAAWDKGDAWFSEALTQLEANRNLFMDRFTREMPEVGVIKPEATYLGWADFSKLDLPSSAFSYLRDTGRVVGGDGANFGVGYEQFVRFNYATSPQILNELIDRIFRALKANSKG